MYKKNLLLVAFFLVLALPFLPINLNAAHGGGGFHGGGVGIGFHGGNYYDHGNWNHDWNNRWYGDVGVSPYFYSDSGYPYYYYDSGYYYPNYYYDTPYYDSGIGIGIGGTGLSLNW